MNTELEQEAPATPGSEDRHSRKCTICNHPDREAIDEAFLHWSSSARIVRDYSLPSISCLYRHAHARGLWLQRRSKIRFALDRIIEQAGECRASANAILRAIEISCRFDKDGRYAEPGKRVVVEHHTVNPGPPPNRNTKPPTPLATPTKQTNPAVRADDSARREIDSNRESQRLETDVTPTKQTPGAQSNRELDALLSATPKSVFTSEIQDMLLGRSHR